MSGVLGLLYLGSLTMTASAVNLTITVTYDAFPEETMWTFGSPSTELFRQDFNSWNATTDGLDRSETFDDLTPGNYQFVMEDSAGNGICCGSGMGTIVMADDAGVVYQRYGIFTDALHVNLQISAQGVVNAREVSPPPPTALGGNGDPEWPGFASDELDHSFSLNIKFDQNPTDISVTIKKKDDTYFNTGWLDFYSYTPVPANANQLWSETFDEVEAGVYYLRIEDSAGNGLGPDGWITMTNHTDVFWQMAGDGFSTRLDRAFMVRGWYGNTVLVNGYSLSD
ncbi:Fibronectin type III domain [Seminavis robusta]|uniref:Fibronectin type III domain n=1 Tax=Seminavis robusta TaxID=568900 RepID=A0A9N8DCI1_9STRA|nr:Fibronectin type III domain [Seminavis robusta]|eukprot:Sro77_g041910.1 Fibronectin type III domain (282) ;mRNA; f:23166-24288